MFRLRRAVVLAALTALAASGLSVTPAAAADAAAAPCDPALAPGLTWTAPSFLAWGRDARVGANVDDPAEGPTYADGSVKLGVDAGSAKAASSPVDSDMEFVLTAPARGAEVNGSATWTLV